MTTTEPRVLITAVKCDRCGKPAPWVEVEGVYREIPCELTVADVRDMAATGHPECPGSRPLIATEPVPTSHLVGGYSWMHSLGAGDLDNEEGSDGTEIPDFGGEAQPQVCASQGSSGASDACASCGQLAFGEHGRCACEEVSDE